MEQRKKKDITVKMSFLEIYNEVLKDLLVEGVNEENSALEIWEDPIKGVYVSGVAEIICNSTEEVMNLVHQGNNNRSTEATDMNQESSRSHAVLLVNVEHWDKDSGADAEITVGKFALIDLAGSERASQTNNRG